MKKARQFLQLLVSLSSLGEHHPLLFVHPGGDLEAVAPEVASGRRAVLLPRFKADPAKVVFALKPELVN